MNSALPDSVVYGDVLMKGFGKNALTRGEYRSVAQYLVRMGYCSVDRDINIDVNSETKKYMKQLSKGELYAVRRVRAKRGAERQKLGMWEERSSSFEDGFFTKAWFALYRPIYRRFFYPKDVLSSGGEKPHSS